MASGRRGWCCWSGCWGVSHSCSDALAVLQAKHPHHNQPPEAASQGEQGIGEVRLGDHKGQKGQPQACGKVSRASFSSARQSKSQTEDGDFRACTKTVPSSSAHGALMLGQVAPLKLSATRLLPSVKIFLSWRYRLRPRQIRVCWRSGRRPPPGLVWPEQGQEGPSPGQPETQTREASSTWGERSRPIFLPAGLMGPMGHP